MSEQALSREQKEIIDLLIGELQELMGEDNQSLTGNDYDAQKEQLHVLTIHLEHVSNALDLAGLSGLSFCTKKLRESFKYLLDNERPAPQTLSMPLHDWGSYFLSYLKVLDRDLDSQEPQEFHVSQLLGFLSQEELPQKLTPEEIEEAKDLFNISELTVTTEASLPTQVTEEMTSLAIASDVRPELLQGLLLELPEQTRQFESSITRFLCSGEFEDLTQAQRMAHTIKGAANVVSIRGIANLTHFSEDLLETAAKNLDASPDGFDELLIRTSDCLAATAEYLNNQGPSPADLPEVMQLLLNWLNQLKNQDAIEPAIAVNETNSPPDQAELAETIEATENQDTRVADDIEKNRYINLAESTAQELLRLSGEIQISNNQVTSQISNIESSIELTYRYHKQIKTMAAELEALIQTQSALKSASMKYDDDEIDPLEMERFSELHTFSNRLQELTTDSFETVASIDQQIKDLSGLTHSQKQLNRDNQNILLEMNLLPVSNLSSRLSRCVRQTCRLTGKPATLTITGEELFIDSRVLNRITDPLMHLLRNAIDHGLEDEQARIHAGKNADGELSLEFVNNGDMLEIHCKDDGAGLNYKKIRANAIEKGLLKKEAKISEKMLNQLIFIPGFSTRSSATQTSGRGIGLDSVQSEVRALKGNISVDSVPGKGSEIIITVPTSILTSHALLIECRDRHSQRTYGIATRGIKQVLYTSAEQFIRKERRTFIQFDDEEIQVQSLGELLNLYSLEEEAINAVLIMERRDGSRVAVGVEKILTSQDLVIKSLNKYSYQSPGVIGATILGDGNVSPVIDLNDLPSMSLSDDDWNLLQEKRARQILSDRASFIAPPAALVVDDSLSARRSLAQFVSDIGMEVYTAKDGFDAIHVMKEKKPSLMLVDLEMPRMNGLELTAHIRARQEYEDIPVIMITSRSTQQHKDMAKNAGVTRYLTKPWSDDELLNCIKKEIA